MKKIFFITFFALLVFTLPQAASAQIGMMGNSASNSSEMQAQKTLADVTNALLNSQNVSSINQLNCSNISQDEFEKVGDAWMGVMAGSEQNHSAMEQRMGGEGSQTLKQAHIQMGENYLGCAASGQYNWMPMMFNTQNAAARGDRFPMMGWNYGYGTMMNGGLGWGFGILALIFWIVSVFDLILLGVLLWKKIQK